MEGPLFEIRRDLLLDPGKGKILFALRGRIVEANLVFIRAFDQRARIFSVQIENQVAAVQAPLDGFRGAFAQDVDAHGAGAVLVKREPGIKRHIRIPGADDFIMVLIATACHTNQQEKSAANCQSANHAFHWKPLCEILKELPTSAYNSEFHDRSNYQNGTNWQSQAGLVS